MIHTMNQHRACVLGQGLAELSADPGQVTCPDCRRLLTLDDDAPDAPHGLVPRVGVEFGCGRADCADCYEPEKGI